MFIRYLLLMLMALAPVVALIISQGLDFMERSQATADPNSYPRTAVVFSGQFDRIEVGLQLIEDAAIDRLLVSGANPQSGIHQARFSDQFNLTIRQRSALANGQIILADGALSTLENAIESECWLQSSPEVSEVLLITSSRHMARASLALELTSPNISVVRLTSDPRSPQVGIAHNLSEFAKFISTRIILFFPQWIWFTSGIPKICLDGETSNRPG